MGSSDDIASAAPAWGIDVGRAGLKALRLEPGGEGGRVRLSAGGRFSRRRRRSEHEDSGPAIGLLRSFLDEHVAAEESVWISLPPERGVHRTFDVESREQDDVEEAVRREVRGTIPLPPDKLVIRYHLLGEPPGGWAHVFAVRREHVREIVDAVERPVDGLQLADVALFNAMLADRNLAGRARRQSSPPSFAFLEMGTSHTSVVVTSGLDFWSRVVPIGHGRFEKAIVEGRGCTPTEAEAILRGERSLSPAEFVPLLKDVYLELASHLNQSFGTFQSTFQNAGITRVVCLGTGFDAPGLVKFLEQQLRRDVGPLSAFQRVTAEDLRRNAAVRDRPGDFAVAYGLALQGLGLAAISTNFATVAVEKSGWGHTLRSLFRGR